ncbi:efflux RND transporter periplasmic adaptor subunit [Desulfobotulus sp.]|jgi:Cu(I)/Ag(I) efflux system membrane fusion protein|uniref:efflux RND transporter periplasmic adaptor subunit n=1 Tax=Desulfobotulus sp. TaxID=1940337 RepID=UPI002A36EF9A|nr:efflux RND transporter periplasmic adaptor subunit [Desulfobotulus sp.]MDY0164153.1 efflux RND transporter periplasmic adaptor subunit [Desulfobotulus sp.]
MKFSSLFKLGLAFILGVLLTAAFFLWPYGEEDHSTHGDSSLGAEERIILYYRHPHNPQVTSETPRKDEMGMDYIPVYADSAGDASGSGVRIAPETRQNLGVRTAKVRRGSLSPLVEAVGYVDYDENLLSHVHVRTEGWVERLVVRTAGERVKRGALLFEFYSPQLVNAQEEYLRILNLGQPAVRQAARDRLLALGMGRPTLEALEKDRRIRTLIPVFARQDGVVSELGIREGMFVTPAMDIMTLADLSRIWIQVEVFEHQASQIARGQRAILDMHPVHGGRLQGEVAFIYPALDPRTRALRVRLSFPNPEGRLKPGMFTRARILGEPSENILLIPVASLIRSGNSQRVIVDRGEGRFEALDVEVGLITDDEVEIFAGLSLGDRVVVSGQFLIDSESSLRASFMRMQPLEEPPLASDRAVWARGVYKGAGASPGSIHVSHEPIVALGWPAMAMDLDLKEGLQLPADFHEGMEMEFALEQVDEVTFRIVDLRSLEVAP